MQSEFSPPLTRHDAVLWFLRVQLWLSVLLLIQGAFVPYGFFVGIFLQSLVAYGVPILVLSLFPRVLASAMLGDSARDPLTFHDFQSLVWRCVGVALFTGALGRAVISFFVIAEALIVRRSLTPSITYSYIGLQFVGTMFALVLGFFLAFGPSIRDNFRAR
ncbi:hypothetical protein EON83_22180 [bacterium]|nr:MAG: hypothetical protein EON83_22180 [bacterium]